MEALSNNFLLVFGLPVALILGIAVIVLVLRRVYRSDKSPSATEIIMDLTNSGSLTPEERERVKKKLHERIKRDMEDAAANDDDDDPSKSKRTYK